MKILPVGAELFHADGRTDMMKLTVAFRSFENSPKNWFLPLCKKRNLSFTEQFNVLKKVTVFYSDNQTVTCFTMCVTEIELLTSEAEETYIAIVSWKYVIGCQPNTIILEILTFNEANKESFKVEILRCYVSTVS
jgi:hypothetical protein